MINYNGMRKELECLVLCRSFTTDTYIYIHIYTYSGKGFEDVNWTSYTSAPDTHQHTIIAQFHKTKYKVSVNLKKQISHESFLSNRDANSWVH